MAAEFDGRRRRGGGLRRFNDWRKLEKMSCRFNEIQGYSPNFSRAVGSDFGECRVPSALQCPKGGGGGGGKKVLVSLWCISAEINIAGCIMYK